MEGRDEVDILHADKHQSFLQVDTIFFMGLALHAQSTKVLKVCNVSVISQERS